MVLIRRVLLSWMKNTSYIYAGILLTGVEEAVLRSTLRVRDTYVRELMNLPKYDEKQKIKQEETTYINKLHVAGA